jgi:chemotaxis protein MotA
MDFASLVGLVVVVASFVFATIAGGGGASAFVDYPSIAVVGGGCLAAVLLSFPWSTIRGFGRTLFSAFVHKPTDLPQIVEQLVGLAETARREGLLALEERLIDVKHPLIVLGVQMAVDGTAPDVVEGILRDEIRAAVFRGNGQKGLFEQLGRFAPAFGMIGTLLGLVLMLGNVGDPSSIGPGMAVALLTTLYGAVLAYGLFLPCAEKLQHYQKQDLLAMELIVKGILAVQSGDHPRTVRQKLGMFVPREERIAGRRAA